MRIRKYIQRKKYMYMIQINNKIIIRCNNRDEYSGRIRKRVHSSILCLVEEGNEIEMVERVEMR